MKLEKDYNYIILYNYYKYIITTINIYNYNYATIITNIQKYLGKGSGQIIDSVIDHTISILKYNPLAGRPYIKLPEELDRPIKGLINIHNTDDNESFKWSIVRYLNPADYHPARIKKADKDFDKRLINFPVKVKDIVKIEKKNSIDIGLFGYENKEKHPIYVSKNVVKKKC